MSNAWFHYVGPLAIATAFVVIGVTMICVFWWGSREANGRRKLGQLCAGIFMLVVGGPIGAFLLTSPTPWERERLFDHIFRTQPDRIERFIIKAGDANQYKPLTLTDVVIDDPARIRQIAEILRTAPEVSPNHPRSRWTALVEMVTRDGTCYFDVNATVPGDSNGTLVSPWSTEEGRWNLGDVRADGLDEVLEDAVSKAKHA